MIREEYYKGTILIITNVLDAIPPLPQTESSSGSIKLKGLQKVNAEHVVEAVAPDLKQFPGIAP